MHRSILILFVLFVWLEGRVAQQDDGAFRDLAPPGLFVGSVFHGYSPTWQEPDYQTLALREFNFMTSSIYLPTVWQDPSQEINVQPFAQVCSFLRENNILVHGHALLYPAIATIADWWNEQSLDNVENRMYQYMTAVVTAGRGLVETWDVVNEVMGDDNNDMDEDGVRRSLFNGKPIKEYQAMGQDYVKKAFQFARQADSNARLLLTDYGIEEDDPENENQKSDRLYRFVSKLLAEGVTIDGIGFQMHVGSQDGNPDYLAIARNFERFRKLGLLIYITEMDVASYETSIRYNVTRPPELDRASRFQGRVYRRVLEICLVEPACQGFRFWDYAGKSQAGLRRLPMFFASSELRNFRQNTILEYQIFDTHGFIPLLTMKVAWEYIPTQVPFGISIPTTSRRSEVGYK
jgi:endo-1,4-beta-xylanase